VYELKKSYSWNCLMLGLLGNVVAKKFVKNARLTNMLDEIEGVSATIYCLVMS